MYKYNTEYSVEFDLSTINVVTIILHPPMPNIMVGSITPKNENKIKQGCKNHNNNDNPNFLAMNLQGFVSVNANTLQRILLYIVWINSNDLIFVFGLSSLFYMFVLCSMFNVLFLCFMFQ